MMANPAAASVAAANEEATVKRVIAELRAARFVLDLGGSGIMALNLSGAASDEPRIIKVEPRRNWAAYCERADDWEMVSEARGEEFQEIMERNGLDMGSVGGHPANVDYSTPGGTAFFYNGNPYHA